MSPDAISRAFQQDIKAVSELSAVLQRHGATIDKYIGDSIMAFWNAPACQAEHADQAIDAACQMRFALARLNRKLIRSNLPPLSIGIAIHTGKTAVGLMGSSQRLSSTAVGKAVNLCARPPGSPDPQLQYQSVNQRNNPPGGRPL